MWERFGSWGHVLEKPTTSLDCREACAREWPFNFNLAHKSVASTVLPILIGQGEEQGFYGESAIVQLVSDGNTNVQLSNFWESCICFVFEKVLLLQHCNTRMNGLVITAQSFYVWKVWVFDEEPVVKSFQNGENRLQLLATADVVSFLMVGVEAWKGSRGCKCQRWSVSINCVVLNNPYDSLQTVSWCITSCLLRIAQRQRAGDRLLS